jgi:uncharacterized membrane protein YccF (DUF307 family)
MPRCPDMWNFVKDLVITFGCDSGCSCWDITNLFGAATGFAGPIVENPAKTAGTWARANDIARTTNTILFNMIWLLLAYPLEVGWVDRFASICHLLFAFLDWCRWIREPI